MTTYLVTRHQGAVEWASAQGFAIDQVVSDFDPTCVQLGDRVIGTLPAPLAATVCERGGRYIHLTLDLPPALRGKELTPADMDACGARLEEFRITRVTTPPYYGYTQVEIENGIGCYTDRPTFIWANGDGLYETTDTKLAPTATSFAGRRDLNGQVWWC